MHRQQTHNKITIKSFKMGLSIKSQNNLNKSKVAREKLNEKLTKADRGIVISKTVEKKTDKLTDKPNQTSK